MKSILIVEDDITYGMILKTWLGKKGFLVSSASSIARAQKHIEAETVDLILSDLRLPDRDGKVGGPSGLRKTTHKTNSLAHRKTWLRF